MTLKELDNLVRINELKKEEPDQEEIYRMIESARRYLDDTDLEGLSEDGRFSSAYTAAHLLSLAALRRHGYRSSNRYQVFQCLVHTVNLDKTRCRLFGQCHNLRNIAEYEGSLEITPALLDDLIKTTRYLLSRVVSLGPVPGRT